MSVVLCHGTFDLLHLGHIRHLKAARTLGDWLIVSVTGDKYVNKGPGRPAFTEDERVEALEALRFVDEVIINEGPDAVKMILRLGPDFYVKGVDYSDKHDTALLNEIKAINMVGGRFVVTNTRKWSSTKLLAEARV